MAAKISIMHKIKATVLFNAITQIFDCVPNLIYSVYLTLDEIYIRIPEVTKLMLSICSCLTYDLPQYLCLLLENSPIILLRVIADILHR